MSFQISHLLSFYLLSRLSKFQTSQFSQISHFSLESWNTGRLVCVFKQLFSVFKQYFTYFNTFFQLYIFSQIFLNNNFQFLYTQTKRILKPSWFKISFYSYIVAVKYQQPAKNLLYSKNSTLLL